MRMFKICPYQNHVIIDRKFAVVTLVRVIGVWYLVLSFRFYGSDVLDYDLMHAICFSVPNLNRLLER